MAKAFRELEPQGEPIKAQQDFTARATESSNVEAIEVVAPGNAVVEGKKRDNTSYLGAGEHGGFTLKTGASSRVVGHPSARVCSTVKLEGIADSAGPTGGSLIEGTHFRANPSKRDDYMVEVNGGIKTVFRNCTFEKIVGERPGRYVKVETGSRAIFISCVFIGPGTFGATTPINNQGAAANVRVIECINAGAGTFGGVTVVGGF